MKNRVGSHWILTIEAPKASLICLPQLIEVYRSILASLDDRPSSFCGFKHKTKGLKAVLLRDILVVVVGAGVVGAICDVFYQQRSFRSNKSTTYRGSFRRRPQKAGSQLVGWCTAR